MAGDGRKSNLGRGLDALLGDDPDAPAGHAGERLARMAPVETLQPGRYQPRRQFAETEIEELAASIRELGILQPLLVRALDDTPDRYEIIAGERRWRAAQRARLHEVPVIERQLTDAEALEIALVENLQREDLSPLDEAEGYKRLADEFDHTQEDLARALGKSRSHVANMMRLLNLPDSVKSLLDGGEISAGHARALLAARDPAAAATAVVRRGLNVRQTERLIQKEAEPSTPTAKPAARTPEKDVDTIALERELAALLGLRFDIRSAGEGGSLTVQYDTLEQLDDILHRLRYGPAAKPASETDAETGAETETGEISDIEDLPGNQDESVIRFEKEAAVNRGGGGETSS